MVYIRKSNNMSEMDEHQPYCMPHFLFRRVKAAFKPRVRDMWRMFWALSLKSEYSSSFFWESPSFLLERLIAFRVLYLRRVIGRSAQLASSVSICIVGAVCCSPCWCLVQLRAEAVCSYLTLIFVNAFANCWVLWFFETNESVFPAV